MHIQTQKSLFEVGKKHGPDGNTSKIGLSPGYNFENNAFAHPVLYYPGGKYPEFFLTADLYLPPDPNSTDSPFLILYCPLCMAFAPANEDPRSLRISMKNKTFHHDPQGVPSFPGWATADICRQLGTQSLGGLLSVEEFQCSWEASAELRRSFGFAVCPWKAVIENNIIREV